MRWRRNPTFRIPFENQDFADYQYSPDHPNYYGHNYFVCTNNQGSDFSGYPSYPLGYPNDRFSYPYLRFMCDTGTFDDTPRLKYFGDDSVKAIVVSLKSECLAGDEAL
ncbi:hypothetical protein G5I_09268 [Acromyrmex echinatior]|uniref:Uncharacterized protein n=1 Tax=Acromyrmex echinatior TaxID=103372 RepID=F4WTR7_ACREC|nr:hypothetical protein G5I_09268 [Acromyrmex echinatior]